MSVQETAAELAYTKQIEGWIAGLQWHPDTPQDVREYVAMNARVLWAEAKASFENIAKQAFGDAIFAVVCSYENTDRNADNMAAAIWPDYAGTYAAQVTLGAIDGGVAVMSAAIIRTARKAGYCANYCAHIAGNAPNCRGSIKPGDSYEQGDIDPYSAGGFGHDRICAGCSAAIAKPIDGELLP